jgi:hypothetical protein
LACKPTRQEAILIGAQRKRYRGDRRPSNLPSWPPLPSPFPPLVLRCSSGLSVSFTRVSRYLSDQTPERDRLELVEVDLPKLDVADSHRGDVLG